MKKDKTYIAQFGATSQHPTRYMSFFAGSKQLALDHARHHASVNKMVVLKVTQAPLLPETYMGVLVESRDDLFVPEPPASAFPVGPKVRAACWEPVHSGLCGDGYCKLPKGHEGRCDGAEPPPASAFPVGPKVRAALQEAVDALNRAQSHAAVADDMANDAESRARAAKLAAVDAGKSVSMALSKLAMVLDAAKLAGGLS
jgi:hypothetical protein